MKRKQFLTLSFSAAAMALIPTARAMEEKSGALDQWAKRYAARITDARDGSVVEAALAPSRLRGALQDLDAVSDAPLSCAGSTVRGSIDGRSFRLTLRLTLGVS